MRALNFDMTRDEYHDLINFASGACGRRNIDKALDDNDVDILMGSRRRSYVLDLRHSKSVTTAPRSFRSLPLTLV